MPTYGASKSTIRWFLALCAFYVTLCYFLRSHVPKSMSCNADAIFGGSILALAGVLCILVGAASEVLLRRDEHPISFWAIVGITWATGAFYILCGLRVLHLVCVD